MTSASHVRALLNRYHPGRTQAEVLREAGAPKSLLYDLTRQTRDPMLRRKRYVWAAEVIGCPVGELFQAVMCDKYSDWPDLAVQKMAEQLMAFFSSALPEQRPNILILVESFLKLSVRDQEELIRSLVRSRPGEDGPDGAQARVQP